MISLAEASGKESHAPDDSSGVVNLHRQGGTGSRPMPDMTHLVALPYVPKTCSIYSALGKGNIVLPKLVDEEAHLKDEHPHTNVKFKCSNCDFVSLKPHATLCHLPKCPGSRRELEEGFLYQDCGKKYGTVRGLSQHQRHKHPEVRNQIRGAMVRPPPPIHEKRENQVTAVTRGNSTWTADEIRRLKELEV